MSISIWKRVCLSCKWFHNRCTFVDQSLVIRILRQMISSLTVRLWVSYFDLEKVFRYTVHLLHCLLPHSWSIVESCWLGHVNLDTLGDWLPWFLFVAIARSTALGGSPTLNYAREQTLTKGLTYFPGSTLKRVEMKRQNHGVLVFSKWQTTRVERYNRQCLWQDIARGKAYVKYSLAKVIGRIDCGNEICAETIQR